jgi:hypothetical protein
MADKKLERQYLNRAFEILDLHPSGDPLDEERPDFLICVDGKTLGVEVTAFHPSEPDPVQSHRARLRTRQLAVEQARRAFRAAGGHALYVKVFFGTDRPLMHKRAYELGPLIADAIASVPLPKSIHDGGVTVQHPFVPPEVVTIHIHGSVSATDELWQAARAECEVPISRDEIETVIARKAKRLQVIRQKCSEAWLLIVNDPFRVAAARLSPDARAFGFKSPFDRTLWLDLNRVYDRAGGTVTHAPKLGQ